MNLPNKLTVLRLLMIPAFAVVYYLESIPYNYIISAVIFLLAATTDFLDGYIARKRNLVTDLGKFLDPIADKVLVATALIVMLQASNGIHILPWYASIFVAIILARELIVSGFRMIAASKGRVMAAEKSGKIKTVVQDVAIVVLLAGADIILMLGEGAILYHWINVIGLAILGLATILTIISGAECIVKNKDILKTEKPADKE